MVKDILTRIENLHDFIEESINDEVGLTLIDKDVILQNLREIYLLSRKIEIADAFDDNLDNQSNEDAAAVVLFDSHSDSEPQPTFDKEVDDDSLAQDDNSDQSVTISGDDSDSVIEFDQRDIFENDLFDKEDRDVLLLSLFEDDSDKYLEFTSKLNEFDDFDEAIIFTYESFADHQSSEALDIIVAYLEKRLN